MKKKSFLYVPTWILILIFVVSTVFVGFEFVLLSKIDVLEVITINGVEYYKGSEQYQSGINTMKTMFTVSAYGTLLFSLITGFFSIKRIRNK